MRNLFGSGYGAAKMVGYRNAVVAGRQVFDGIGISDRGPNIGIWRRAASGVCYDGTGACVKALYVGYNRVYS